MASHELSNARQESARQMPSAVIKRSVVISGRKTSVSLEDAFWRELKEIAHSRHMTLSGIVGYLDSLGDHGNLSSTMRLFVLEYARAQREAAANDVAARSGGLGGDNTAG